MVKKNNYLKYFNDISKNLQKFDYTRLEYLRKKIKVGYPLQPVVMELGTSKMQFSNLRINAEISHTV